MTKQIDSFLLAANTAKTKGRKPKASQPAASLPSLQQGQPLLIPLMSIDRFSELVGVSKGVLRGNIDKGYIPTKTVGRRRMVNLSKLNHDLIGQCCCCNPHPASNAVGCQHD